MPRKNIVGDGDSDVQKRALGALPDAVRATKKSSTPVASDTTDAKGAADKNKSTTNRNLAQGKESDAVRTTTSYFDPVCLPSAVRPGGEGITSRFCGTLNGRNRCVNIILKDRTLQFV